MRMHQGFQARMVQIEQDILGKNNQYAAANREYFNQHGILTLNLVSSPGSGKTTLLTETIALLKGQLAVSVIEGTNRRRMMLKGSGQPVLKPYKSIPAKAVIWMRIRSVMRWKTCSQQSKVYCLLKMSATWCVLPVLI